MRFIENIILKAELRKVKAGIAEIEESIYWHQEYWKGYTNDGANTTTHVNPEAVQQLNARISALNTEKLIWARQLDALTAALANK